MDLSCLKRLQHDLSDGTYHVRQEMRSYTIFGTMLYSLLIFINVGIIIIRVRKLEATAFHYYMHFSLIISNVLYIVASCKSLMSTNQLLSIDDFDINLDLQTVA